MKTKASLAFAVDKGIEIATQINVNVKSLKIVLKQFILGMFRFFGKFRLFWNV